MASRERIEYHNNAGHYFMDKAWKYLEEDDLAQTSEKGWGAAAQMVKAAAEARDWRHNGHGELFRAINRLANETDDNQLRTLFHVANSLHVNFYEGWMPQELVEDGLEQVSELVRRLERLQS